MNEQNPHFSAGTFKTAVLTGATGFIGSAVLSQLLERGYRALVLVRPGSDRQRIASLPAHDLFTFTRLEEPGLAEKLSAHHPDVFIHCAWRGVAGAERNAAYQITDNLPLTIAAVELAAATGCRQWIALGSQAEYGNLNHIIDESMPNHPTTLYGKAKLAAAITGLALCESHGITGTWMRVFSTYGTGDAPYWFIPSIIREFLAGTAPKVTQCEQMWDYLHVRDAARAIVSAAEKTAGGIFNLGSGTAIRLRSILETIKYELGSSLEPEYGAIPYRPDQVMHLQANVTKLREATGWQPIVPLAEGIREMVAEAKSQACK